MAATVCIELGAFTQLAESPYWSIEQWGPLCGNKLIYQGLKIYAHSGVDMAREATSLLQVLQQ